VVTLVAVIVLGCVGWIIASLVELGRDFAVLERGILAEIEERKKDEVSKPDLANAYRQGATNPPQGHVPSV
jgi:hypothetical protein